MARKRDYEPWDSTRYRSGTKKCHHGHEGRIPKSGGLFAGCLQDHLAKGGYEWRDDRSALTYARRPQEPAGREDRGWDESNPSENLSVDPEASQSHTGLVVLVCGSREWTDKRAIFDALFSLVGKAELVIHGAARGADTLAGEVARELAIPVREYPADWDHYGKGAGYIRNSKMLKEGQPDLVLAFTDELTGGTGQMVKLARKAGVETRVYGPRTTEAPTERQGLRVVAS